ncbi:MAG: carbohydrate kinase family protein [Clostridia bacterium]|nr:carbohydrate kinase family protein [Clostridia bacterium]MBQ9514009.1 carbohydrate kinase family protein [Clostridia bacterium]
MNKGIAVIGSSIVDNIKEIEAYPNVGELSQIKSIGGAVGGCVANDSIDLKTICKDIDIYAVGKIGEDANGQYLVEQLRKKGVDTSHIVVSKDENTAFTDVMYIRGGERTFFSYMGASATFGYDDIDFEKLNVDMAHIGYFLLLDKIDNGDGEKILKELQRRGIKTSIDLVSEKSDRYKLVVPCLKHVDNLIINEKEGGQLAGIDPKPENIRAICTKLKEYGVKERVIIHMPESGYCLSDNGFFEVPSYICPKEYIKGSNGAGDAFCSGALIGIYKGWHEIEILEFGSAAALVSLGSADAVSGMKSEKEIKEFCKNFTRRK